MLLKTGFIISMVIAAGLNIFNFIVKVNDLDTVYQLSFVYTMTSLISSLLFLLLMGDVDNKRIRTARSEGMQLRIDSERRCRELEEKRTVRMERVSELYDEHFIDFSGIREYDRKTILKHIMEALPEVDLPTGIIFVRCVGRYVIESEDSIKVVSLPDALVELLHTTWKSPVLSELDGESKTNMLLDLMVYTPLEIVCNGHVSDSKQIVYTNAEMCEMSSINPKILKLREGLLEVVDLLYSDSDDVYANTSSWFPPQPHIEDTPTKNIHI